jgi:hypothetical protein
MDELFFTGMDILEQTRKLVETATDGVCKGLTDSEREAYLGGVANTLSALQCMLEVDCDGEPIVHISGIESLEEMSIEELEDRFLNN